MHWLYALQSLIQELMLWHVQVARQRKAGWQSTISGDTDTSLQTGTGGR